MDEFDEAILTMSREFTKKMLMLIRADLETLKTLGTSIEPTKLDIFTWATLERIHDVNCCLLDNIKCFYACMASKKAGNDIIYMMSEDGYPMWREKDYFEAQQKTKNPIAT